MRYLLSLVLCLSLSPIGPAEARFPGAEIVFTRFSDERPALMSMRPGGKPKVLKRGQNQFATWSPDRTKIAFVSMDPETLSPKALWTIDRNGSNQRKVVDLHAGEFYQVGFDWSPDSSRLVFSDRLEDDGSFDLFVAEVATGDVTPLTTDDSANEFEPDWSPTTDAVVYYGAPTTDGEREHFDVYKIRVSDGAVSQLTTDDWDDYSPMWSPDGSWVAFFSTRDDYHSEAGPYLWELYLVRPDGSDERRLTEQATRKTGAVWSPGGTSIAFNGRCDDDVCGGDYDDNIYVVDVESGRIKRLTGKGKRTEGEPSWSPDSRWIVFQVLQRGGRTSDLWAVRLRDRKIKRLTETPRFAEGSAQWAAGRPGGTDW